MSNVQNIHLCQNPSKTVKKIEKFSKIRQKSSKIFENVENYAKCIIYPKNLKFVLNCQNQTINVPKPLKFLDLWPFLIPSPDIQKTKFFQFLLLASSLAQKLKKFCFLDVWVGIHLVVSGYRVVIICILSQNRQKWQKKAKTTQVCAFVEGKPFGVEKSYLQFWMRTNLKIQHKF